MHPAHNGPMRRSIALLALAATACAHIPDVNAPASLAAAETAFAAHSVRQDMRAAFMAAFADDGVFIRDIGWAVSNNWLRDRPAPPIVLDWRPRYVEVATSGDLGLSTGPWKITSKADPSAAAAHGQFVSLWRRTGSGPWQVVVDLGIGHKEPALWDAPLEARMVPTSGGASAASVVEAEAQFARAMAQSGPRAAYEGQGAADLRYYRNGQAPVASRAAALVSPAMGADRWVFTVVRSETAASNDFAYTRGTFAAPAVPTKVRGYYMRVWRREAGQWRIVMDVVNPAAPS